MGWISLKIELLDVYAIVIAMRSEPFDPDNSLLKIDCDYQPIGVAPYVEDDPIARDDARGRVKPFDIGWVRPSRLPYFVEPSIERRLERLLIPAPGASYGCGPRGEIR